MYSYCNHLLSIITIYYYKFNNKYYTGTSFPTRIVYVSQNENEQYIPLRSLQHNKLFLFVFQAHFQCTCIHGLHVTVITVGEQEVQQFIVYG